MKTLLEVRGIWIRQDLGDYDVIMDKGNGVSNYRFNRHLGCLDLWQIVRPFIYEIIIKLVFLIIYEIVQWKVSDR